MEWLLSQCMGIIRDQKHDFLNHLQVISGLLQLGRPEEASQYMKKITLEINRTGLVTKLADRRMAFYLTLLHQRAKAEAVSWEVSLTEDVFGLKFPAELVETVHNLLAAIIATLAVKARAGESAAAETALSRDGENLKMILAWQPSIRLEQDTVSRLKEMGCQVKKMGDTMTLTISSQANGER